MIVNDKLVESVEDTTLESTPPLDAPPSYEASGSAPPPSTTTFSDSKHLPLVPTASVASGSSFASSSSSGSKSAPASPSWFNFASLTGRQSKVVRTTVLGLVRDLVKLQPSDHTVLAVQILKSCADACRTNGLSISTILQEKSVEGHTPLYWAIVKRPAESHPEEPQAEDLLTTLLTLSSPLSPATMADVRLACLLTSDQVLFQRLRNSPEFAPLSPTDEMLLDVTMPPDDITVENVSGDEGAFIMDFAIVRFQKRMLVSKSVAEHRRPHLPPAGTWYASLSLLENSPPTWVDSRLLVPPPPESATEPPGEPGFASGLFGPGKPRARPTLSARMKATEQLRPPARGPGHRNRIIVLLDGADGDGGLGSLQYAGCPYIASDETLRGRLEARLAKPEADCIIC
ncbi:hypothetical protein B0H16DRAFT_1720643 [Mycena metata]|uniref:Uncharacterized protein n=1 Tax=Mycena metata TaxID=1033252 RepID=A0AAD7NEY3_9AGAR|nr:hypothetical protein B0H16DRAFT_1720643 [Mycena metata]